MVIDQDHPKGHRAQDHPIFAKAALKQSGSVLRDGGPRSLWLAEHRL
jgi:hypothetical protein